MLHVSVSHSSKVQNVRFGVFWMKSRQVNLYLLCSYCNIEKNSWVGEKVSIEKLVISSWLLENYKTYYQPSQCDQNWGRGDHGETGANISPQLSPHSPGMTIVLSRAPVSRLNLTNIWKHWSVPCSVLTPLIPAERRPCCYLHLASIFWEINWKSCQSQIKR